MTHQATGKYINFVYKTVRDKYYNIETFESTVHSFYFDKMYLINLELFGTKINYCTQYKTHSLSIELISTNFSKFFTSLFDDIIIK